MALSLSRASFVASTGKIGSFVPPSIWTGRGAISPSDVGHLSVFEDAGNVVVNAVAQAEDAGFEGVEVAADDGDFDSGIKGCGEERNFPRHLKYP